MLNERMGIGISYGPDVIRRDGGHPQKFVQSSWNKGAGDPVPFAPIPVFYRRLLNAIDDHPPHNPDVRVRNDTDTSEADGAFMHHDAPLRAIPMFNENKRACIRHIGADGPHIVARDSSDTRQVAGPSVWLRARNDTPLRAVPMLNQCL